MVRATTAGDGAAEVAATVGGDETAFADLSEGHRRELHVRCYRMLASFDEADDAVQETPLKVWRGRPSATSWAESGG